MTKRVRGGPDQIKLVADCIKDLVHDSTKLEKAARCIGPHFRGTRGRSSAGRKNITALKEGLVLFFGNVLLWELRSGVWKDRPADYRGLFSSIRNHCENFRSSLGKLSEDHIKILKKNGLRERKINARSARFKKLPVMQAWARELDASLNSAIEGMEISSKAPYPKLSLEKYKTELKQSLFDRFYFLDKDKKMLNNDDYEQSWNSFYLNVEKFYNLNSLKRAVTKLKV